MGPAMVDRADVEVARFDVAEAAFGVAEALVGEDDGAGERPLFAPSRQRGDR